MDRCRQVRFNRRRADALVLLGRRSRGSIRVTMPATEPVLAPGTMVGGRYRIVRVVGAGGMGAVYEAQHTDLKKRVAVKTLYDRLARLPEARARFLREGEAASRMRHPHIVDVTDVGTYGEMPFLVMEYLEGEDLGTLLATERRLSLERALDLLLPAIAAVAAGHAAGIVHRDIKPQNIFLARGFSGEMVPKVLDFGVSKLTGDGDDLVALTGTAAVFGTPAYMSPEQARGAKGVDARTDQYSMAAVLYECVTGRRAHEGDQPLAVVRQIGDGVVLPPRLHCPELPLVFEQVLLQALSREPADRFATMTEFGKALLPLASSRIWLRWGPILGLPGQSLPAVDPSRAPPLPHTPPPTVVTFARKPAGWRRSGRWRMLLATTGGLLAAVVLAAIVLPSRDRAGAPPAVVVVPPPSPRAALAPPPGLVNPGQAPSAPALAAPPPDPASVKKGVPAPGRSRARRRHRSSVDDLFRLDR
jgi:eukaryotic-like serine/threonine-protein kinase